MLTMLGNLKQNVSKHKGEYYQLELANFCPWYGNNSVCFYKANTTLLKIDLLLWEIYELKSKINDNSFLVHILLKHKDFILLFFLFSFA